MRASQFIKGHVSQSVKVESEFTDYELAVMEGGSSLEKPRCALREAIAQIGKVQIHLFACTCSSNQI